MTAVTAVTAAMILVGVAATGGCGSSGSRQDANNDSADDSATVTTSGSAAVQSSLPPTQPAREPQQIPRGSYVIYVQGRRVRSTYPTPVHIGDTVEVVATGLTPDNPIDIVLDHQTIGHATTDSSGLLQTTFVVSQTKPGIDLVDFDGSGIGLEVTIDVAGIPQPGDTYVVYLCCFDPTHDTTQGEVIDLGGPVMSLDGTDRVDFDGGVTVVSVVPPSGRGTVTGTSRRTGKVIFTSY